MDDCATPRGVVKGTVYQGEKVAVSLIDAIRGRVARQAIVDHITDEVVVQENQVEIGRAHV